MATSRAAIWLALVTIVASACGGSDDGGASSLPSTTTIAFTTSPPTTGTTTTVADTTEPPGSTTSAAPTTAVSTTSAVPTTAVPTTGPPAAGAFPSIPVGPDGIEYAGGGDEIELVGPSRLTIDGDGTAYVYDPVRNAIWMLSGGVAPTAMDLGPLDILNVEVFAATDDALVLVEIFFAPVRRRLHRLSYDGAVLGTLELPDGFGLEDGLSGIHDVGGGSVALEYEGGMRFSVFDAAGRPPVTSDVLSAGETTVAVSGSDMILNGRTIAAEVVGFGGMQYLGSGDDGTAVVLRSDVVETVPMWRVLVTVEWYRADGELIGSARVPLDRQVTDQPPGLAVRSDGAVFALITGDREVTVVELVREARRITELDASF